MLIILATFGLVGNSIGGGSFRREDEHEDDTHRELYHRLRDLTYNKDYYYSSLF